MKRIVSVLLSLLMFIVLFNSCTSSEIEIYCDNCSETIKLTSDIQYAYCPNCGTEISEINGNSLDSTLTDEQKLIGTWVYVRSGDNYTYTFYSDGSCYGQYRGYSSSFHPSLVPYLYNEGSGQGYWSIVDNKLKIDYRGKYEGVQYYEYSFNEDCSQLTVDALTTDKHGADYYPIEWIRYPTNSNLDAYEKGKLTIKDANDEYEVLGYGLISEAEIEAEDGTYWVNIRFTDYGLEQFNSFRSTYSGTFTYEIWVEDEHLVTLDGEGILESNSMSFSCDNLEEAKMTAYKLNQTSAMTRVEAE